jgi:hypothetical protein
MNFVLSALGIGNKKGWDIGKNMFLSFSQNGQLYPDRIPEWALMSDKIDRIANTLFKNCTCGTVYNLFGNTRPTFQGNYLYNKISDQEWICEIVLFACSVISIAAIIKIYNLRQKIKMQQSLG